MYIKNNSQTLGNMKIEEFVAIYKTRILSLLVTIKYDLLRSHGILEGNLFFSLTLVKSLMIVNKEDEKKRNKK